MSFQLSFQAWMRAVDNAVIAEVGLSVHDLADANFRPSQGVSADSDAPFLPRAIGELSTETLVKIIQGFERNLAEMRDLLLEVWEHSNMTPLGNGLMDRIAEAIGEEDG